MGKPSPASRRAAEEAQRRMERLEVKARRRQAAWAGMLAAALLVLAVAWWMNRDKDAESVAVGTQVSVPHASSQGRGITLHATPKDRPTLVVYEDYQCPWCKVAHDDLSPLVEQLATEGAIGVEVRSITLLDSMLKNDASLRANIAAACADVDGRYASYRDQVFAHQPQKEGDGYSDDQLRVEFAQQAGLADAEAFRTCYDQRRTNDAVQQVLSAAKQADKDGSSPQYWVADQSGELKGQLDLKALMGERTPTKDELLTAIKTLA